VKRAANRRTAEDDVEELERTLDDVIEEDDATPAA
jgi:hypothetical protein